MNSVVIDVSRCVHSIKAVITAHVDISIIIAVIDGAVDNSNLAVGSSSLANLRPQVSITCGLGRVDGLAAGLSYGGAECELRLGSLMSQQLLRTVLVLSLAVTSGDYCSSLPPVACSTVPVEPTCAYRCSHELWKLFFPESWWINSAFLCIVLLWP